MRTHRAMQYHCEDSGCQHKRGFNRRDKLIEHMRTVHNSNNVMQISPPANKNVKVAIISTHQSQYDAIRLLFDTKWEESWGTSGQDFAFRTLGYFGRWAVVLVCIMGTMDTITLIASTYPNLELVLVIDIVSARSWLNSDTDYVNLGDVIISKAHDGKETGLEHLARSRLDHAVKRHRSESGSSLSGSSLSLFTSLDKRWLQRLAAQFRVELQAKGDKSKYQKPNDIASKGDKSSLSVDKQDNSTNECTRDRESEEPGIHLNMIDLDMPNSTELSRSISEQQYSIAAVLKESGSWKALPFTFVSGVCDIDGYWKDYVALTSASATKAILHVTHGAQGPTFETRRWQNYRVIPFGRNSNFIGRKEILEQLLQVALPTADVYNCQRTAIVGLGGIGKTQIAIEVAYRLPDSCSVFWVPAISASAITKAFLDIGRRIGVTNFRDEVEAIQLVKDTLSCESAGDWLLIFDNADDKALLFDRSQSITLSDCLPFSPRGSILFTTRNYEIAVKLGIRSRHIIHVCEMTKSDALNLLQEDLTEHQTHDEASTYRLLEILVYLPLAIRQASTFMACKGMSTTTYLKHCAAMKGNFLKLLGEDFEGHGCYKEVQNPLATAWTITFEYIQRDTPRAADYLKLVCFLASEDIQLSWLPMLGNELEVDVAIGALKVHYFLTERCESHSFDIHPLVQQAAYIWIKTKGPEEQTYWATMVIQHLSQSYPSYNDENSDTWARYLPHAKTALSFQDVSKDLKAVQQLGNVAQEGCKLLERSRERYING